MNAIAIGDGFRQAMERAGLVPPAVIPLGKVIRFPGVGKSNGNTSGWAWLAEDGQGGGFGDWSSELSATWHAQSDHALTGADRAAHRRRVDGLRRFRQEEEARQYAEAAQRAQELWDGAKPAPANHPYLERKRVQPYDLRVDDESRLLIPVRIHSTITSLQFIDASGGKRFLRGGKVRGGCFFLGDLREASSIIECEGFATAASLHEGTGYPVVMAFSAPNLYRVGIQLREQYPDATILVCADNDIHDDGKPNDGLKAATVAARAIGGFRVVPELDGQKCDFNDLARAKGLDAVRSVIEAGIRQGDISMNEVVAKKPTAPNIEKQEDETTNLDSTPINELGEFPDSAWRGAFAIYRDAMVGTSEAPDTAHFSAFWAVAAACLRRRVMFYYAFPHYPNVFIVNYGKTGDSKTSAARQGLRLLPNQGVKVLRGVGSAEALGDWMQQSDDGPPVAHLLFIEELATVLTRGGWEGSTLLSFLTETFDTPDKYEIPFRKNPVLVTEPTPTLIAGTTIEWFWKGLRELDVHGGFGNRIFYLTGAPKAPIPLPAKPNTEALASVHTHLQRLLTMPSIELFFMPDAQAVWKEFYFAWKATTWPDLTAAAVKRVPTYIVKLSMVYACLEGTSLISKDQLEAAIEVGHYGAKCTNLLMNRHRQQTIQGKCESRVLSVLDKHDLPTWKIHRTISGSYSAEELARAIRALDAAGAIIEIKQTAQHKPIWGRPDRKREV